MAFSPVDHSATAPTELLAQFRDKPRMQTLVVVPAEQLDDIEAAGEQLYTERYIETAIGEQLDVWGRILDLPRGALSDDDYRIALQAQVLVLRSNGAIEEIYAIFETLSAGADYTLEEHYPAKFQLSWLSPALSDATAARYAVILHRAKAGGVGVYLYWYPDASSVLFAFSDTAAGAGGVAWGSETWGTTPWGGGGSFDGGDLDSAQGFADTDQLTGGKLTGIVFV